MRLRWVVPASLLLLGTPAHAIERAGGHVDFVAAKAWGNINDDGVSAFGCSAAVSHAAVPGTRVEFEVGWQHVPPPAPSVIFFPDVRISTAATELYTALLVASAQDPGHGHWGPFARGALGVGAMQTGEVRITSSQSTAVFPGEFRVSPAFRIGFGFGQVPAEGLGWEAGIHVLQLLSSKYSATFAGFSTGVVF